MPSIRTPGGGAVQREKIEPEYIGRGEPDLGGLGFVVHILNLDFDSMDQKDLLTRMLLDS